MKRQRVQNREKRLVKIGLRGSWMLKLINVLLLALLGYLGFLEAQNVRGAWQAARAVAATAPGPINLAEDETKVDAVSPLNNYRAIWERNLFNISTKELPAPEKKTAVEKIALAKKEPGLKLTGTAVATNSSMSRAFIENSRTREQEIYREGDTTGKFRIKRILRNKVIVGTAEGDRLLMVDFGGASRTSNPETYTPRRSAGGQHPQQIAGQRQPGRSITLAREEVKGSLANIDELKQQLNIEPYVKNDQPAGFLISRIPPQSIFRKMGLNNGSAIMGVNDKAFTGPEQAIEFFQTLANGGKMTIKIRKGRGVRRRTRFIHLSIE